MFFRTLSVATLTTLAAAQSPLTQPRSVEDLLPASTYAAMRFGGLEACKAATGKMPLTGLIETFVRELPIEHRRELLEDGLDDVADELRHELKRAGLRAADLRALLRQPMVVALGRLSIEGMGPSVALLIEEGQHKDAITRALRAGLGVIRRAGAEVSMQKTEVAGMPMYHVQIEDGPPLFAGSIGGSYCVSNSRGYLRELARVADGKQQGLTQTSRLGALRQQLPAQPLVSAMANTRLLMDMLEPHMPYEAADYADALGVGRLELIYAAATATQAGGSDLFHVGVGGSANGIAKALYAQPADLSFASACSDETVVFGAGSFDVPALLDAAEHFVTLLPANVQQELRREFGRELSRELRHVGMSAAELQRLLHAFGGQAGFALSVQDGPVPKPDLMVRLSVKEREPIAAAMLRVEALVEQQGGVEWHARDVAGVEVRFCGARLPGFNLSPCYALTDGGLWIGSDVGALSRALRRGRSSEQGLAAQADFRTLAKKAAGCSGVLHVRTFRGVELGWRTIETQLYPMIDAHADELGFDSGALPDREQLAEALGTTSWFFTVGDEGVTARSEGLFALGSFLAAFGALGHEVLDRAAGRVF